MDNKITKGKILAGALLILASIGFFMSWYLMPDPGTTDTIHILNIVKQARISVHSSVIIQIVSSVLYMVALALITQIGFPLKKITLVGVCFLGVGVLGLCSDAFFHLLAWFMTDDSVNIQKDVIRVMDFMQTGGVVFLIPLLLPFFIGSLLMAIGFSKQGLVSKTSGLIISAAFLIGVAITISAKLGIYHGSIPMLTSHASIPGRWTR